MKTRRIGRTSLNVTEISFGCASIGNLYRAVSREDAEATLQTAWAAGIRYFDAAPRYGHGLAEIRLGHFLHGKARDGVVVSTKVGRVLRPVPESQVPDYGFVDPMPFAADYDYSYDGVMRSFELSLARLGLNRIDIVYVHDIGEMTHGTAENARHRRALLEGGLKALDELKSSGAVRAVGLGVNEVAICLDLMSEAPLDCILLAGRYTLLDRTAAPDLLARCAAAGTSLVVGGVFNSGILATGPVPGAPFDYEPASPEILDRVGHMAELALQQGVPLAAAALHFPLRDASVSSVLIGTGRPAGLTRNLDLLAIPMDAVHWQAFEAHALGPDGTLAGP